MSRSGYSDDCWGWDLIRWRGAVASAIRGRRGQAFLREMLAALDRLPEPKLIAEELEDENGAVCALGSVGKARNLDMGHMDLENREEVANSFGIPVALAAEIMFENDEAAGYWVTESPEERFRRVRAWVAKQITPDGDS